jgi:hypothetical protein
MRLSYRNDPVAMRTVAGLVMVFLLSGQANAVRSPELGLTLSTGGPGKSVEFRNPRRA